ncbi:MAG TPA: tol-pal system-associated acyl-CoA thioesterase [Macromonas sp.]|nr:tol-pal system-associated acyl-CoA thioesterase [Macromonas sp.]
MFHWPVRVYWEDTDAGGIVFYANYLKFFERARTEWLRHLGLEQHNLRTETGGMFVVASTEVKYLRPAQLDDLLQITATVRELDRVSMTLHQQAWRLQDGQATTLLCEGSIRIVWVEAARMRASRIPDSIQHLFKAE